MDHEVYIQPIEQTGDDDSILHSELAHWYAIVDTCAGGIVAYAMDEVTAQIMADGLNADIRTVVILDNEDGEPGQAFGPMRLGVAEQMCIEHNEVSDRFATFLDLDDVQEFPHVH